MTNLACELAGRDDEDEDERIAPAIVYISLMALASVLGIVLPVWVEGLNLQDLRSDWEQRLTLTLLLVLVLVLALMLWLVVKLRVRRGT